MKTSDITKTCVFLQLNLSRLGDKRGVSSEAVDVDADKETVKVRKVIFQSASFDAIKSLDGEVRRYIRGECFPFEAGIHLVPIKMVAQIETQLQAYARRRTELVKTFAAIYPTLVREAQPKLRVLFNEKDYKVHDVADSFSMGWQFLMFTAPAELESISADMFRAEREKMTARMNEAYEEARQVLRQTMLELISHLRQTLEPDVHGAPKRLAASTLNHLQEFLDTFNLRNVTDDAELQRYTNEAKKVLKGVDIDALRMTDGLRQNIRVNLNAIEQAITNNLEVAPKRRIKVAS